MKTIMKFNFLKMKYKAILLAVFMGFFSAGLINAQSNTYNIPDQLRELIKKSFDNYPRLKAGNEYLKASQVQRDLAKAGYMPTIDGEASYRYGKPTPELNFPGIGTFAFIPANNYDFHLSANLPIWDFGRTQANVQRTLAQIETSQDNLEGSKQMLAYQVAELYCAIIFYNKSIEVQQEEINVLKENEKIIGDRVKDGDALKFDLLSTQVKRNAAENMLIDLQNALKKDYEFMDMLTGTEGDGYITRTDMTFSTEGHEDISADKNIDLKLLNDQLKMSEVEIKAARNNWMPTLSARGQIGYQNGYVPDVNKIQLAGAVGVGLSIPIYGIDRPNYRIKIAKINAQAAQYNIDAKKMELDKDIMQAKTDLASTKQKIQNYEVQIQQAQEALNLANIRYQNGVITNLELLTAQTNLQDAELGKIRLEFQILQSVLQINKLGGVQFWQ
ncbi:MAG TPA: TolC family protein [Chitinophagales bacterium]|nr:TolC family protein [Chitinophagales bacterium]